LRFLTWTKRVSLVSNNLFPLQSHIHALNPN
jgi:hypothetical protein